MRLRLMTGVILAAVVSGILIFFSAAALKLLLGVLVAIGCYECARLVLPQSPNSSYILLTIVGTLFSLTMMFFYQQPNVLLFLIPGAILFILGSILLHRLPMNLVLQQVTGSVFVIFYFCFLFSFLGLIRDLAQGWAWLFLLLATTFGADTGAFFAGRFFGKHKLAPEVSPGKTVEGLLGGIVLSIFFAFLVKWIVFGGFSLPSTISIKDCFCVGLLASLVGPWGDLSESLLKRSVGVKDSGSVLPGHGGMLDRVDALLFTAPLIYGYALYFYS